MDTNQNSSIFDTGLDTESQGHLLSVSKWTKFLSIVAFIVIGLLLILVLATGSEIMRSLASFYNLGNSEFLTGAIIGVVIVALVVFLWFYFLFKASVSIRKGLDSRSSAELAEGFKALRIYFVFSFVISLISLISSLAAIL